MSLCVYMYTYVHKYTNTHVHKCTHAHIHILDVQHMEMYTLLYYVDSSYAHCPALAVFHLRID